MRKKVTLYLLLFLSPIIGATISSQMSYASSLLTDAFVSSVPSPSLTYLEYQNIRFRYIVPYPAELLFPQGESDNGDGQVFLSRDAAIELIAYGGYTLGQSLEQRFKNSLFEFKKISTTSVITYKIVQDNWYVISGVDNKTDTIFYLKEIVSEDQFKRILLFYPEERKMDLDEMVTTISRGFRSF